MKNNWKKVLSISLALVMVIGLLPVIALADWAPDSGWDCGNGIHWMLSGGTLTIVNDGWGTGVMEFTKESGTVPYGPWYQSAENITAVVIQEGVVNIAEAAFADCPNLKTISLPKSLIEIGTAAFYRCPSLTSINVPESVQCIGESAFGLCTGLTSVTLPESVVTIKPAAFHGCTGLTSVTLPANLKELLTGAFDSCEKLSVAEFKGDVPQVVGDGIFQGCANDFAIHYGAGQAGWTTPTWTTPSGDVYRTVGPGGHVHFYQVTNTVEPTCTEGGFTEYTCSCGDVDVEYFDALGHAYEDTVVPPTHTQPGSVTHTCVHCGDSYVDELPAGEHTYTAKVTAPTCTERGFTTYTCDCGASYSDDYVDALGHAYEKTGHKDPTATVDGYDEFTCTRCGDSYRETISATGKPGYPFVDMPKEGNWARPGVEYVIDNGLMGGTDATHFSPNDEVSRAMLVTTLWRAAGSPQVEYKGNFSDVKDGKYYTTAVAWAAELGIVRGDSSGRFNPADNVTRQDLANVLYQYAITKGVDTSERYNLGSFSDGKDVSTYAKDAMSWMLAKDILRGADGKITPKDTATRAQFALILMNFIELTK